MSLIPTTSETLLNDLAMDSQNARWREFVERYRPMMRAYMSKQFQGIDADEVIQETLIDLIDTLPVYHYDPEETGHFHNYLTGILRHKALDILDKQKRRNQVKQAFSHDPTTEHLPVDEDLQSWQQAIYQIALQQFKADESVQERSKQVFSRLIKGEKPEAVADAFGMKRNTVDKIKSRMMKRFRELVEALEKVDSI